ncbi:MAG: quinol:cytochrome C oxidoreductase [Bacteroidetes bacterium]|nr:quinol:cytochrome C oxidoreductase [Bacteroidota bacterium]MBU1680315.1 quinol:cytochrome C oxidoreductase [Bacteroidota bacterium]
MLEPVRSAFNNAIMLMFLSSIGVGSLFFVALEYLGGAVWSTPFRRISEFLAAVLLILPIVVLPLLFNLHDLFHWTHLDVVESDKILSGKSGYLNASFFIIRTVAFYAIWILFFVLITRNSYKQDLSGDQKLTAKNIKLSAIFMPLFAITVTFSAIDWLMSLEPHWFSTIFGVYYFSGTVLAGLAAVTFIVVVLNENGYLAKGIIKDHYYSLGALLFAFTNFWAYIAFSQFLLIWYANLPEETVWFLQRWEGSWIAVSLALLLIRFLIPYFGLLSQPSKMNPKRLKTISIVILFAHFLDLYWLIMPTYSRDGFVFGWIEIGFLILTVGLLITVFILRSKNTNMIAIGDPKLKRGLNFRM